MSWLNSIEGQLHTRALVEMRLRQDPRRLASSEAAAEPVLGLREADEEEIALAEVETMRVVSLAGTSDGLVLANYREVCEVMTGTSSPPSVPPLRHRKSQCDSAFFSRGSADSCLIWLAWIACTDLESES